MRTVIIILSVLFINSPNQANAVDINDEDDDLILLLFIGTPATLASSLLFPLMGLAIDGRENRPYFWRVVGYTALASSVGAGLAYSRYGKDDDDYYYEEPVDEFITFPLMFGAVGTVLTHILLSRRTDKTSSALLQFAPQVSVSPVGRGGSIRLN